MSTTASCRLELEDAMKAMGRIVREWCVALMIVGASAMTSRRNTEFSRSDASED